MNDQEFIILVDLLAKSIDANKGFSIRDVPDGERLYDAHCLANKFLEHALTVIYLCGGTDIQSLPSFKQIKFVDSASIDVLVRASFEAFLVFHYVFYSPVSLDEKNYRYWSYKTAGLAERQSLPEISEEIRLKKTQDKERLSELRAFLETNVVFQSLSPDQKEDIFEGKGRWKCKPFGKREFSWREIAIDARLGEMIASHMYKSLCGFAHSSSMSCLQAAQALLKGETYKLVEPSIITMKIITANMIDEYSRLFSKSRLIVDDSGAIKLVNAWIQMGQEI